MNRRDMQRAIVRGVRLLDIKDPDWWKNDTTPNGITLPKLDMENPRCCVIGQRNPEEEEPYCIGIEKLGTRNGIQYGFDLPFLSKEKFSILTELWIAVIDARRHPRRRNVPQWIERIRKPATVRA